MQQNPIIFDLKNADPTRFPGHFAHVELTPYRKKINKEELSPQNLKQGAVAVILDLSKQQPTVILTKRADYKGVHGGQVSFPGGKTEENDTDLVHTAMRETNEEIGIVLPYESYVNKLTPIYIPPSNFWVNPFVFVKQNVATFTINNEVNYVVELPLNDLMYNLPLAQTTIQLYNGVSIKDAPCFKLGNEIIWGATAAILNELKWILLKRTV